MIRGSKDKVNPAAFNFLTELLSSVMSPFGVGILDKVDGVGTCPGILLHLEVVS